MTLMFILMYLMFLTAFLPIVFSYMGRAFDIHVHISNVARYVLTFFLGLTSVLNPMLVLFARKEFRIKSYRKIRRGVQNIEMRRRHVQGNKSLAADLTTYDSCDRLQNVSMTSHTMLS